MRFIFETLFEEYVYDPSIIELVLWFPHLSWGQFATATLAILSWNWISERLWRAVRGYLRSWASRMLGPVLQPIWIEIVRLMPAWAGMLIARA